ncbi:MAG: hypothetical protein EOO24_21315 [Comamonadaceae bacterium]|nr:MAG: hypothetical protein EOO24_21315 [Comamonadaceae bacterium]
MEALRDLDRSPYALNLAIQQLTLKVGTVPLHDLMLQAASIAERHFLLAALAQSGNDVGEAARFLGITQDELVARRQRLDERDD